MATSREASDPLALARNRVTAALDQGFAILFETHRQWWFDYWHKASISLPNRTLERQWFLDQYKFGAAARRGSPPISLQAVWTADNGKLPPWKGDYHHDLNTELSYWPCYTGNRLEQGLGFLDWLWSTRDTAFAWTRRFYGLPGLNVPMTVDLSGNPLGRLAPVHAVRHHRCLAGASFLSALEVLGRREHFCVNARGHICGTPPTSWKLTRGRKTLPENARIRSVPRPRSTTINPNAWFSSVTNYDLALERWLMGAAAEVSAVLGHKEESEQWKRILAEFADLSIGDDGSLLLAAGQPLTESHRHFSHLMAIYPLGLIDGDDNAPSRRMIQASLAQLDRLGTSAWTGYSFAWQANLAARARDGEKAEKALEIFVDRVHSAQ